MTAVLLAAGLGARMEAGHKLTLPFGATTVVGETARALVASGAFARLVVVTGHRADAVEAAVREAVGEAAAFVHNAAFADGMSGSIAAGVRVCLEFEPLAIMPGDLPLVRPETIRLIAASLCGPADLVRPTFGGIPGHPVVFGADHVSALRTLAPDDAGARALARKARLVPVDDAGVAADLDTRAAYDAARRAADGTPCASRENQGGCHARSDPA